MVELCCNVTSAQQSASGHRCCPWRPWSHLHAGLPAGEVRQELGQAQGLGDDGLRLHRHAGVLAGAWVNCFGGPADAMQPGAGPGLRGKPALLCSARPVQPSPATAWLTDADLAAAPSAVPDPALPSVLTHQLRMQSTKLCLQDADMVVLESLEHLFCLPTDFALVPSQGYHEWTYNSGGARVCCMSVCP